MTALEAAKALFGAAQPGAPLSEADVSDFDQNGVDVSALRAEDPVAADRYEAWDNDPVQFVADNMSDARVPIWDWLDRPDGSSEAFPGATAAPAAAPAPAPVAPAPAPSAPRRGPPVLAPICVGTQGGPTLVNYAKTPTGAPAPTAAPAPAGTPAPAPAARTPAPAPAPAPVPAPAPIGGATPPSPGARLRAPGTRIPVGRAGTPVPAPAPTPAPVPAPAPASAPPASVAPPLGGRAPAAPMGRGGRAGTPVSVPAPTTTPAPTGQTTTQAPRRRSFDRVYLQMLRRNTLVPFFRDRAKDAYRIIRDPSALPADRAQAQSTIDNFRASAKNYRDGGGVDWETNELFGYWLLELLDALYNEMDLDDPAEFIFRFVTGIAA